jgi:hypothetical protein
MKAKLAIRKDSIEGRRISACIDFGIPLNILEIFGRSLQHVVLEDDDSQDGHFIFQIAFLFTTARRGKIALFDRAKIRRDLRQRVTKGQGILCSVTPDPKGEALFEDQVLQKVSGVQIRAVKILGEGISHRGPNTYLLTVVEVVVESEDTIKIKQSKDKFVAFVDTSKAADMLGAGREVDRSILKLLRDRKFDQRAFIPSAIDCWIQHNVILGVDTHRFSTYTSHEQVLKYITLQVHIQKLLEELKLAASTIQTGDGGFVVFSDSNELDALNFCFQLHNRITATNVAGHKSGNVLLRYALHAGSVYKVLDLNRQANFIGAGINYCARLLNVKEANVLYASKDFRNAITRRDKPEGRKFQPSQLAIKHQTEPDKVYFVDLK